MVLIIRIMRTIVKIEKMRIIKTIVEFDKTIVENY